MRLPLLYLVSTVSMLCSGAPPPPEDTADGPMRIRWAKDMLTITSPRIPGEALSIRYLEAFCRPRSTDRDWAKTVIPHRMTLMESSPDGSALTLRSIIEPGVEALHSISASEDAITFDITLHNATDTFVDVEWAQPCIRVDAFTGLGQEEYIRRCFIFTDAGYQTLDALPRTEQARYLGGQVYVPVGIDRDDVNPRPLSPVTPKHDLIGCVSDDERWILAAAWDHTQELFQGIITCIHSDFRVGGLQAGETKTVHGKLYLMPNDPDALLARYLRDFAAPTPSAAVRVGESPTR